MSKFKSRRNDEYIVLPYGTLVGLDVVTSNRDGKPKSVGVNLSIEEAIQLSRALVAAASEAADEAERRGVGVLG